MTAPRRIAFRGVPLVAGLTWALKHAHVEGEDLTMRLRRLLPQKEAPFRMIWDTRVAQVEDKDLNGLPALSQLVARSFLPPDIAGANVLVALSDEEDAWHTAFVLTAGLPVLGPEQMFDDRQALVAWVAAAALRSEVAAVVASDTISDALPDALNIHVIEAGAVSTAGLNTVRKRSTARTAVVGGAAVALAVAFLGPSVLRELLPKPPVPVVPTEQVAVNWNAFNAACTKALAQRWPLIPGWAVEKTGCTPNLAGGPGKAWKVFRIERGHNVTIATRVAQVIYAHWPTPVSVSSDTLTISDPLPMHWKPVRALPHPLPNDALSHDLARAFLGVMNPDAVPKVTTTRGVQRQSLQTSAGIPDALDRLLRVPGIDLVDITSDGKSTTLTLAAATTRRQPIAAVHPAKR